MNNLTFLNSLRPAILFSAEKPCIPMSNGKIRRQMKQGAILINEKKVDSDEETEFPVTSLVFFPKSKTKRTTII